MVVGSSPKVLTRSILANWAALHLFEGTLLLLHGTASGLLSMFGRVPLRLPNPTPPCLLFLRSDQRLQLTHQRYCLCTLG